MATSVIFLIKKINPNRHVKHENLLSIHENMDYLNNVVHCDMFKIPENIATIYYKISLCFFQYQYCGYIAKTRLHSWKIIQIFS